MFNSKSDFVKIDNDNIIDYVVMGKGEKSLVMIPGLGDGLQTVKGKHLFLSIYYRKFLKDFRLYIFSRRRYIPEGYSTRDMANNLVRAFDRIGIDKPHIIGLSMGGMIAQYIGIDHPDKVDRVILAITLPKAEKQTIDILKSWVDMAEKGEDFKLVMDTMEKTYTEKSLRKYRLIYPLLRFFSKIKDPNRLIRQAEACINHNAVDELNKLSKPVLVLGGNKDMIAGNKSSGELHEKLPDSRLYIYDGYGHGVYEERKKDFEKKTIDFLSE